MGSFLCPSENLTQAIPIFRLQALARQLPRRSREDLCQVHHGVACHGEGEPCLALQGSARGHHHQSAGVENRRQGSEPALIVVLRAEVGQHGIGEMALHQFGGPALPFMEQLAQRFLSMVLPVAMEQLRRHGWRPGAGVEQGDAYFPPREP